MPTTEPRTTRRAEEGARWPDRARPRVRALATVTLVVGALVTLGWLIGSETLVRPIPGSTEMRMVTSVSLVLLSAALLLRTRWARWACAGLVVLLAGLSLVSHLAGVDTGLGSLVVGNFTVPADTPYSWRPSWATMTGLILLAGGLALRDVGRYRPAQVAYAVTLAFGVLSILGYAFDTDLLNQRGATPAVMALHTALSLVLLAVAAWSDVPDGLLQWTMFGRDAGAALQRRVWPIALLLLPVAGSLRVEGERRNYFDTALGTALLVVFAATVFLVTAVLVGMQARKRDEERDELLDQVRRVNLELEERVRSRSHQLDRQRTKIALFEERDRIARDLHDRVIQRIFASGLQVASLSRTAFKEAQAAGNTDSRVPDGLDTVATELDLAIRELRNSIFELTTLDDQDDLHQVVVDICTRASRILAFMPRIEVSGDTAAIRPDLVAHAASVIQEGLSNVARHARATGAEVKVTAQPETLTVAITDDGVGLPDPLPRSSGISNMLNRAKALGGTATWQPGDPSGTVFTWQVPMRGAATEEQADYGYDTAVAFSDSDQSLAASSGS